MVYRILLFILLICILTYLSALIKIKFIRIICNSISGLLITSLLLIGYFKANGWDFLEFNLFFQNLLTGKLGFNAESLVVNLFFNGFILIGLILSTAWACLRLSSYLRRCLVAKTIQRVIRIK